MEDERKESGPDRFCDGAFRRASTDTLSETDHYWTDVLDIGEVLDDLLKLRYVVWYKENVYRIKALIYHSEIEARS